MPRIRPRSVLTGISANQIMRRQLQRLGADRPITEGIRRMVKYRTDVVIVDDEWGTPAGVVSKTDTMMAFYGGLPAATPMGDIMMGPLQVCYPDDTLESALTTMQASGIHQIFVKGAAGNVAGMVSYGDIVGLVYRYCRTCTRSHRNTADGGETLPARRVAEVMSTPVAAVAETDGITEAMDLLVAQRLGAVLVATADDLPAGVISKTDLARVYLHGIDIGETAAAVMTSPVTVCRADARLADAIQMMLLHDIQRLFVVEAENAPAVGVLSLSDAARFRSGTCRACTTSRLMTPP